MFELLNTLYVQAQGTHLNLDHDSVRIRTDGEEAARVPLLRLESIVVFGNVSISPFLIHRCGEDGRAIVWLTQNGRISGSTRGNVLLRLQQVDAHSLDEWCTRVARQVVAGKLQNTRLVLLRAARDAQAQNSAPCGEAAERIATILKELPRFRTLNELRGAEGEAARAYFGVFGHMVRGAASVPFDRSRRPPRDGANALLGFLYALLRGDCVSALEGVGLDPQVGFLHTSRPGRPALALDLMEELRPLMADRLALTLLNRRQVGPTSFEALPHGGVQLTDAGRRAVLTAWRERKSRAVKHRLVKARIETGLIPHLQARLLARHLRGDLAHYPPFIGR